MNLPSPCNGICRLDGDDICAGCFRSKDEITRWRQLSDHEKSAVISALAEREKNRRRQASHG